jgi:16S rRNA (guanine1207-N2)-methyltransferase
MINPAQSLIIDYLYPAQTARILILEGGAGELAREAARRVPGGEVLNLDRDFRNVRAAQALLAELPNARTGDEVLPASTGWDLVLLPLPKERRFTRALLVAAWQALVPGGELLLAGPTQAGAKAAIQDAERLFGNATLLGYKNHQRVARCRRGHALPDPLPAEFQQPGIAPGTAYFIEISHPAGLIKLATHPGIFSWEALDEGSALLLDHLQCQPGERAWDVGCGYGVIGLSAALAGAERVWMSDVNRLAVEYAHKNAEGHPWAEHVEVFAADGLTPPAQAPLPTVHFDLIVSNPAFHRGRAVNQSMAGELITSAPTFLSSNGRLVIVANRFLAYDKLMQAHFPRVRKLAETGKFHVIEARK